MNTDKLLLYAVTDRSYLNEKPLSIAVEEAILGGATIDTAQRKGTGFRELYKNSHRNKKNLLEIYGTAYY